MFYRDQKYPKYISHMLKFCVTTFLSKVATKTNIFSVKKIEHSSMRYPHLVLKYTTYLPLLKQKIISI